MRSRSPSFLLLVVLLVWASGAADSAPLEEPPSTILHAADHAHDSLSRRVIDLSRWVDSFFGNLPVEEETLGNSVRLAASVEGMETESPALKLKVSAKLRLPHFSRRLALVLASFRDEDPAQFGVPGQFASDEALRLAALRYVVREKKMFRLQADLGLHFHPEPDLYSRLRARYQLTEDPVASRVIQYLFWSRRDGWGETSRFEMESKIAPKTFARSSTAATWSEESRGVDWSQGFSAWHSFSTRRAIGLEWLTEGFTDPRLSVEKHRLSFKYRRRVARDWLFIQVGPFIELPRKRDFEPTPGITFQVETVFGDTPTY
jgi:hypothetical protein